MYKYMYIYFIVLNIRSFNSNNKNNKKNLFQKGKNKKILIVIRYKKIKGKTKTSFFRSEIIYKMIKIMIKFCFVCFSFGFANFCSLKLNLK